MVYAFELREGCCQGEDKDERNGPSLIIVFGGKELRFSVCRFVTRAFEAFRVEVFFNFERSKGQGIGDRADGNLSRTLVFLASFYRIV